MCLHSLKGEFSFRMSLGYIPEMARMVYLVFGNRREAVSNLASVFVCARD